jgi:hypothetical protein
MSGVLLPGVIVVTVLVFCDVVAFDPQRVYSQRIRRSSQGYFVRVMSINARALVCVGRIISFLRSFSVDNQIQSMVGLKEVLATEVNEQVRACIHM